MVTSETGEILWQDDYTPFGSSTGEVGFIKESGRFTGKDFDEDVQLFYSNARWYDPELGRFITSDPIRANLNWYAYCSNNPLRYTDPSGLRAVIDTDDTGNPIFEEENVPKTDSKTDPKNILNIGDIALGTRNELAKYEPDFTDEVDTENYRDYMSDRQLALLSYDEVWDDPELLEAVLTMDPVNIDDWNEVLSAFAKTYGETFDKERLGRDLKKTAIEMAVVITATVIAEYVIPNVINRLNAARGTTNPLRGAQYSDKVLNQMAKGDYHGFPKIVDNYGSLGNAKTITGGDGLTRTLLEIPGAYGGKEGVFQYIIESNGMINHRLFVPTP